MSKHSFYEIVISSNSNRHVLTYRLEPHRPAQVWADMVSKFDVSVIRPSLDPWRGIATNWDTKVKDLNNLISELNSWLPNKIDGYWNNENIEESLNRLHVHFPEQEKVETDMSRRRQLTRYNDLIHEMQFLHNVIKNKKEYLYLLVCPDVHQSNWVELEDDDFLLFRPKVNFGDLTLHYPHAGRHPMELFISRDTTCPADQILPQHKISPFHTLRFFDNEVSPENFKKFYFESNLKWPAALEDPRLAVGYINLGKLEYIDHAPWTREDAEYKVKSCNKIENWKVY